jgi:hypothetical protein
MRRVSLVSLHREQAFGRGVHPISNCESQAQQGSISAKELGDALAEPGRRSGCYPASEIHQWIIDVAIFGFEEQKRRLDGQIADLRAIRDGVPAKYPTNSVPVSDKNDRELLGEALDLARQIGDEVYRVDALVAVAMRLPGVGPKKVLQEALVAARQIAREDSRLQRLSMVAKHIDISSLAWVFHSSPELLQKPEILPVIARAAEGWTEFRLALGIDQTELLDSWLLRLSRGSRDHLVNVVEALVPVSADHNGSSRCSSRPDGLIYRSHRLFTSAASFHRYALGQVAGLIDVAAAADRDVIGE